MTANRAPEPMPHLVRTFVAIELPGEVHLALARVIADLRPAAGVAVRWVNPEGVHLTLKFLGEIEAARVSETTRVLDIACAPVAKFNLGLGAPGAFPNPNAPRVLWIGITGNLNTLVALQRRVDDGLHYLGFAKEDRAFSPHLTLGRVREGVAPGQRRALGEALANCQVPPLDSFPVDGVALMRSQLTPQGPIYTRLHRAPLGG